MNEKQEETQKIKVTTVIIESVRLCRANYKIFAKIAFFIFLAQFILAFINYIFRILVDNKSILIMAFLMFFTIAYIAMAYLLIKFSVALTATISEKYKNKEFNFKNAMSVASERMWRFFGVSLRLFLIMSIPLAVVLSVFFLVENLIAKYMIIAVFSLIAIYLYTIYKFAPLIAIIDKDKTKYFAMSKKIVKGDLLRTAFLTVFIPFIFMPPLFLYYFVFNVTPAMTPLANLIFTSINGILHILITPLTTALGVVLYHELIRIKRIGLDRPRKKKLMTRLMKMKF